MVNCLLVWVDWVRDEWGWARAVRQKLVDAGSRVALEQAAVDCMHGPLDIQIGAAGQGNSEWITMSLFIDGTAIEVFSSSGKAASTRMYWPWDGSLQLSMLSMGGTSTVEASAWEMDSIWEFGCDASVSG